MSETSRSRATEPITVEPFSDVETAIAETTRMIAALRDRWPAADNEESLEDTLRFLADRIASGSAAVFVPTATHLLPYRAEAIKKTVTDEWDDDEDT